MSGNLRIKTDSSPSVLIINNTITIGTTPSNSRYDTGFALRDKNYTTYGTVFTNYYNTGNLGIGIQATRTVSNVAYYNALRLLIDNNGNNVISLSSPEKWRAALYLNSPLVKVQDYMVTNFTIPANGSAVAEASYSVPSGYSYGGITDTWIDGTNTTGAANMSGAYCYNHWVSGGKVYAQCANRVTGATKCTVHIQVLYYLNT